MFDVATMPARGPSGGNALRRAATATAVLLSLAAAGLAALPCLSARAEETIDLIPDERAGWSPSNIFSFARPGFHEDRLLQIETTPPGAKLDLFYVRASFQKRYEKATAPVTVALPTRAAAGKRDSVTIRAALDGYKIATVHVPVRGDQDRVMIDLEPLSNTLAAVSHTYFAGRAGLTFLTRVPAQV